MEANNQESFFKRLKNDLPSSLVVFLVALPLCLGIALASGAPLFSGIISGIVGGIVVGALSGSPLGVSGPAAGLAVIVLSSIQELGSFEVFLFAVVIAGVIQFLLGVAKAGVIGYYFPSSVIKGMLSGIGIIIILKQIPHAFGYDADPEGDLEFLQVDGHNTFSELFYMIDRISPGAMIIAFLSLAILILWEQPFMKKISIFKLVQGPLVAVVIGIVLNLFFQDSVKYGLHSEQVVNIPVSDSLQGFFGQFTFPDFSQWNNPLIYITAITIAVVASLETLLCVEATDKLDPQKRITPTNRELLAQGAGNVLSGFIGGLPVTQVIVRSSANIQSGGKSKLSAIFHGILLLISAMAIPHVLNLIPLASLAAILLMVGYKLAKPSVFRDLYSMGKSEFTPFIVTILGIVFTDLLIGIGLGLAVAVMNILWNNYKIPYHFEEEDYQKDSQIKIELSEDVSFLNKAPIMRSLQEIPEGIHVVIDASKTKNIHPDILEIIEDFHAVAKKKNITLELKGLEKDQYDSVEHFGHIVLSKPKPKKTNLNKPSLNI
jgi:MFS superfamily sulfate permease-like transporter